jgi:hypothetical protein
MDVNTLSRTNVPAHWSRILIIAGSIAMAAGAIDLMEGSLVILPGSGLVALGTFLDGRERRLIAYRMWVFILIAAGVGALWGLSLIGGIGGEAGHSLWWGLLVIPYPVGWYLGIVGPGSPRWLSILGIAVGLWYIAILTMVMRGPARPGGDMGVAPIVVIGALGVLTVVGCLIRLVKRTP